MNELPDKTERNFIILGAASTFIAVAAGAFGAHSLKNTLSVDMLAVFETGARYQMYHALALLLVARMRTRIPGRLIPLAGWMFVIGTLLFCGSLYLLAITGRSWFGAITPLGGLCFLAGWILLAVAAIRWR